jgi:hypothetical protein
MPAPNSSTKWPRRQISRDCRRWGATLHWRFMTMDCAPGAGASTLASSVPQGRRCFPGPLAKLESLPFPVVCAVVGLLWCAVSFFLYSPPLFLPNDPTARINDFMKMAEHPLRRDLYEPILAYRVSVPLIAHVLGFRGFAVLAITYAANVAFISTVFACFCRRASWWVAFLGTGLIALSEAGQTGNTWFGYGDPLCHLCTTIAMLATGPVISLVVIVGVFADERIVLALPFVILWHWTGNDPASPPEWRRAIQAALMMAAGLAVSLVLRHMLTVGIIGTGIVTPPVYDFIASIATTSMLGGNFRKWPIPHLGSLVFSFRWLWLLPAILYWRTSTRTRALVALTVVALLCGANAVFWGGDHGRGIAFMFPAFIWMIVELAHAWDRADKLFVLVLIASMLTPQFTWDGGLSFGWTRPFPIVAVRLATGKDPADLVRAIARCLHHASSPAGVSLPARPQ